MRRSFKVFILCCALCALTLLGAPALAGAQTAHKRAHATNHKHHAHKRRHTHKRHHARKRHHAHKRRHAHKRHRAHKRDHAKAIRHASNAHPADTGECVNTSLKPGPGNLEAVREATLCLVNRERVTRGERPLQLNGKLAQAAQGHSDSMAAEGYFSHVSPNGSTPLSRMRAAGYATSSRVGYEVGENIAWGTLGLATPKAIVEAWMNSPGHRENILDANYRETAIGVSPNLPPSLGEGQPGALYTQDFGVIITR